MGVFSKRQKSGAAFSASSFPDHQDKTSKNAPMSKLVIQDFQAEAQREKDRLVQRAMDEVQGRVSEIERKAYMEGHEKGEQAGQKLILKQLSPYLESFRQLTEQLVNLRDQQLKAIEPDIMGLAVQIARKVIHGEIKTNQDVIKNVTVAAIQHAVDREVLTIRISPEDHQFLKEFRSDLLLIDGVKEVQIEEDSTIDPGGCLVESQSGDIDATIPTQIGEFENLGALDNG